jgi:epoxyqueuosine reductase
MAEKYQEAESMVCVQAGKERFTSKNKYILDFLKRFDQKYVMYNRPRWDIKVIPYAEGIYGVLPTREADGFTLFDRALQNAGWYLEMAFAHGHIVHGKDLFSWEKKPYSDCLRIPKGEKLSGSDPAEISRRVKNVARFLGADLVGICELDSRWIYSHWYNLHSREEGPLEVPPGCKYAIAIAVEMDYEMFRTSPKEVESAATGMGYSKMALVAGSLAHFIRDLGYTAIPSGNDTGLSIPIAIDAGLGELGRNGLLITKKFGPRVRLCKVITDLPLVPDEPVEFGVSRFCEVCRNCAENCPSMAIQKGERTGQALNESNNPGVLKWPIDAEKCFKFWSKNHTCCGNCIRVCPFNKPDTPFHRFVRWLVENLPQFDRFYKWMDDICQYGKQIKAEDWWSDRKNNS